MEITTKSQRLIDRLIIWAGMFGLGLALFSLIDLNWLNVGIGILVAGICYYSLMYRIKNRVEDYTDTIWEIESVLEINEAGFKMKKMKDKVTSLYQWKDIKEIGLKNKTELHFRFNNNQEKIIDKNCIGYYQLLAKIPTEKLTDNFARSYQTTTFENLKTCPICGYIAYKVNTCLSCKTDSFEISNYNHIENEADFLKEEQLDYFCTMEKGEAVEFHPKLEKEDVFKFDKNWKPIVTESEVLAFSKENCWD